MTSCECGCDKKCTVCECKKDITTIVYELVCNTCGNKWNVNNRRHINNRCPVCKCGQKYSVQKINKKPTI